MVGHRCGHRLRPADAHLSGGLYLHLVELALALLAGPARRCDPPPHAPAPAAQYTDTAPLDEEALIATRAVFVHR